MGGWVGGESSCPILSPTREMAFGSVYWVAHLKRRQFTYKSVPGGWAEPADKTAEARNAKSRSFRYHCSTNDSMFAKE